MAYGAWRFRDTSPHGQIFRQMMNTITERYRRHIRISHKPSKEQKEQLYGAKQRWRVVAYVTFKDGRTGIKVLPRIVQRIVNYYNVVSRESCVECIELYATNHLFFNRYPSSSAFRVHDIDRTDAEKYLQGAERLVCDGENLEW